MNKIKALIFNDTRPAIHFGCERVMDNLLLLLKQCNIEPIHLHSTFDFWENKESFVRSKIKECDLVIVNGEGSIHHSNAKAASLAAIGPLARSLGKPAILLNTTFYKNNSAIYSNIAKYSSIYVRDAYSASEFIKHGGTAFYAPDLTFFTDIPLLRCSSDITRSDNSRLRILIGESVLKDTSTQLSQLAERKGWERLYIHHTDDLNLSIDTHFKEMQCTDLIITGRFHTVCFCINMGIPFIALESNTNKISNLLNDCFQSTSRLLTHDLLNCPDLNTFSTWTALEKRSIFEFKERGKSRFNTLTDDLKMLASTTA